MKSKSYALSSTLQSTKAVETNILNIDIAAMATQLMTISIQTTDNQSQVHTCSHLEVTFENGLNLTPNWPVKNCMKKTISKTGKFTIEITEIRSGD